MDKCPTELLVKIFTLACTDGGKTGCALSLVSSQVHVVSREVQLYSVSVNSIAHGRLLLKALQSRALEHRKVRHLFLSDKQNKPSRSHADNGSPYSDAVAEILDLTRLSLMSLSLSLPQHISFDLLARPGFFFPCLHNLIMSCFSFDSSSSPPIGDAFDLLVGRAPTLPALERLHLHGLSSHGSDRSRLPLLETVTHSAPSLTHLRLSGITHTSTLPQFLATGLDHPTLFSDSAHSVDAYEQQPALTCRLPAGLRHVAVQPAELEFFGECEFVDTDDFWLLSSLVKLKAHDQRLALVPEGTYDEDDAMKDWMDVAEGGVGCWQVEPTHKRASVN